MPKAKQDEWRGIKAPTIKMCPNLGCDIWMAGDVAQAKQVCREFCREVGLCVTVEPVDYIYTGGEESGFRVGLINYPRFPKAGTEIQEIAARLAARLCERLCQQSYTIETGPQAIWFSHRPADAQS